MVTGQISIPELGQGQRLVGFHAQGLVGFPAQGLVDFCAELVKAEYVSLALV